MSNDYTIYNNKLTKHFTAYLKHNYPGYKLNDKHKYILNYSYPPEIALLKSNRELFKKYIPRALEIHSKSNLKSSQLMMFDFFLPYLDKETNDLSKQLNISGEIVSIEFEKLFKDYTHVDVFMKNNKDEKIVIEVKYKEEYFDKEIPSENRNKKFTDGGINYLSINNHMLGSLVTKEEFLANYQLFRNLYNAFIIKQLSKNTSCILLMKFSGN